MDRDEDCAHGEAPLTQESPIQQDSARNSGPAAQHDEALLRLVRDFALEGGITQPVNDQDARAVLDHFACPEEEYRELPTEGSPEFLAELQRRSASARPHLAPGTIAAYLRSRWASQAE
jgi:hypothetical protein